MRNWRGFVDRRAMTCVVAVFAVVACSITIYGDVPGTRSTEATSPGARAFPGMPAGAEVPIMPVTHAVRTETAAIQEGKLGRNFGTGANGAATGVCDEDVDCDDCKQCTNNVCVFVGGAFTGTCSSTPSELCDGCGDRSFCNGQELCNANGECREAATRPCESLPDKICDESQAQAGNDPCVDPCQTDGDCTDTLACNGTEVCVLQECVGGDNAGAACTDNAPCTGGGFCGGVCDHIDLPCGTVAQCDEGPPVVCSIFGRCCTAGVCSRATKDDCVSGGGIWLNVGDDPGVPGDQADCDNPAPAGANNAGETFGCPVYGAGIAPAGALVEQLGPIGHAPCVAINDLGDDYTIGPPGSFVEVTTIRWTGSFEEIGVQDNASRYRVVFYDASMNRIEDTITNPTFGGAIGRRTVIFQEKPIIPATGFVVIEPAPRFAPFARVSWMTTDEVDTGANDATILWVNGGPTDAQTAFPGTTGILAIEIDGKIVGDPRGGCCDPETGSCQLLLSWECENPNLPVGDPFAGFFQGVGVPCQVCVNDPFKSCNSDVDCPTCEGATNPGIACNPDAECPPNPGDPPGSATCEGGVCIGGTNNGNPCDPDIDCDGTDTCSGTTTCQPVPPACALSACCATQAGVPFCEGGLNPGDACPTGLECQGGTCTGATEGAGDCVTVRGAFCSGDGVTPCFSDAECVGNGFCEPPCPTGTISNGFGTNCSPNCCDQPQSGFDTCVEALLPTNIRNITVPPPGDPPVTATFSGNNLNATFNDNDDDVGAGLGTCNFGIFSSQGGTKDRGWWHSFSINACADIRVDLCCTRERSGEIHQPQWANLWNSCNPCTSTLSAQVTGPPVGTDTQAGDRGLPFCPSDDLWQTYKNVPLGQYSVPIFSAPGGHFGDYQLHVTVAACSLAACCMPSSYCVANDESLVLDGAGNPIACDGANPCASGTCEFCALVNQPDCDAVAGFWNGLGNIPSGSSPIVTCNLGGEGACDIGSCCIGPGQCEDRAIPDTACEPDVNPLTCMTRSQCDTLTQGQGTFLGGGLCDFPKPPCPACVIQGEGNCQLPPKGNGFGTGQISDLTTPPNGTVTADDFIPQGAVLDSVCVWGFYHDPSITEPSLQFECIGAVEDEFRVRVYADNNGMPGALIGESLVTGANIGRGPELDTGFQDLYGDNTNAVLQGYTLTLDTPISGMQPGQVHWLEVANNSRGPTDAFKTCYWNWLNFYPATGDGYSFSGANDNGTEDPADYLFAPSRYIVGGSRPIDMAFCLGTSGGPLTFDPGTEIKAACWTCPSAGEPTCTLETRLACAANDGISGIWNRADTTCGGTFADVADLVSGDQCVAGGAVASASVLLTCGDNILDPGEQCDDGNLTPGDGCDANCLIECPAPPVPTGTCEGGPTPGAQCTSDTDCGLGGVCVFGGGARVIGNGLHAVDLNCADTDGSTTLNTGDAGQIDVGFDAWFFYTTTCTGKMTFSACPTGPGLTQDVFNVYDNAIAIYHDPQNPTECVCPGTGTALQDGLGSDEGCNGIPDAGAGILTRTVFPGECYTLRMTNFGSQSATAAHGPEIFDIDCIKSACFPTAEVVEEEIVNEFGSLKPNIKNRFLSVVTQNPGRQLAIRVTFDDLPGAFSAWNGTQLFAGEPTEVCQTGGQVSPVGCTSGTYWVSQLECSADPVKKDWSTIGNGVIHLYHEGIIPLGTYTVQVMDSTCNPGAESSFSPGVTFNTAKWGDIVGNCSVPGCTPTDLNGTIDIVDALAGVQRFVSDSLSPGKERTDIEPACVDFLENISDVLFMLSGFQGLDYPFVPIRTDPCDPPPPGCAGP